MKPSVPLTAPIFRSQTQAQVLAMLVLFPDLERTSSELSRAVGVSLPTVVREVDRLVEAGVCVDRVVGRNRLVRVNPENPYVRPLAEILARTNGPIALAPKLIAPLASVTRAYIYGSWAARYQGVPGADPTDIDIVLVGNPDRSHVAHVADECRAQLGRDVNLRIISEAEWANPAELFTMNIKKQPLVQILPAEPAGKP